MLIFTFDCDMSLDVRKILAEDLRKRTGQDCMVLPFCTGVYTVILEKEGLNECSDGDGS